MTRGVVCIAHNTPDVDYYKMACYTAERVNRFLNLPVTIITDTTSVTDTGYQFDNIRYVTPDSNNIRDKKVWINKGRYQVYDLTPYDDTLVIDIDYMVNSQQLLKTFDYPSDFVCHNSVSWIMSPNQVPEFFDKSRLDILWATVMRFTRSSKTEQIFGMIKMIQENYQHYSDLHGFMNINYRNDYALTAALHTVNGNTNTPEDYLTWDLVHVNHDISVDRTDDTEYIMKKKILASRTDTVGTINYIRVRDMDFHMLNKDNFGRLM